MSGPSHDRASPVRAEQPVLVFDSGVGGLSVLAQIRMALPTLPVLYAADYAAMPYGVRSEAEIAERVPRLLDRLCEKFDPRLVVIACNTASTIALDHARRELALPIVGTVPAIKPAALLSRTRVIGVLGTEATVRQSYVDRLSSEFASDAVIIRHGAPELVIAAEAVLAGRDPGPGVFERAIDAMRSQPGGENIDVVVLACTHFPLVADRLAAIAGPRVTFIDGAAGIARRVESLTAGQAMPAKPELGRLVVTAMDGRVEDLAPAFARFGLGEPELFAFPAP